MATPPPQKLSPTELKVLALLADGKPHHRAEVAGCFAAPPSPANLWTTLCNLRRKLRPHGETVLTIVCGRDTYYSWGRRLASPYDGRR